MSDQNHLEKVQDFLDGISLKLIASKSAIQILPEEHKAYIEYHNKVDLSTQTEPHILSLAENLFLEDVNNDEKKRLLFLLAHEGSVESFRIIEKYLNQAKELKNWAFLCMEECRNFMESDLLEEDRTMVMSGMGGENHRLRYAVVLSPKKGLKFEEKHGDSLEKIVSEVAKEFDSALELIKFERHYAVLTLLVSMDVALDDVVMAIIKQYNEGEALLREHYYCTNVTQPSPEEIEAYLNELN